MLNGSSRNSLVLRRLLSFVALSFWTTSATAKDVEITSTEATVARIAEREIAAKAPDFDSIKYPPVVHDSGSSWEVYYKLPDGTIGGTPVVVIDKATLSPIKFYRTQ